MCHLLKERSSAINNLTSKSVEESDVIENDDVPPNQHRRHSIAAGTIKLAPLERLREKYYATPESPLPEGLSNDEEEEEELRRLVRPHRRSSLSALMNYKESRVSRDLNKFQNESDRQSNVENMSPSVTLKGNSDGVNSGNDVLQTTKGTNSRRHSLDFGNINPPSRLLMRRQSLANLPTTPPCPQTVEDRPQSSFKFVQSPTPPKSCTESASRKTKTETRFKTRSVTSQLRKQLDEIASRRTTYEQMQVEAEREKMNSRSDNDKPAYNEVPFLKSYFDKKLNLSDHGRLG